MDKEYKGIEKTVQINGEDVRLLANAQNSTIYRNNFGRDLIGDFYACTERAKKGELPMDELTLRQFIWTMAKAYDTDLLPFNEWEESLIIFPYMELLNIALDLTSANMQTTSNIEAEKKEVRAER